LNCFCENCKNKDADLKLKELFNTYCKKTFNTNLCSSEFEDNIICLAKNEEVDWEEFTKFLISNNLIKLVNDA
jgi:hypothetical protein